MLPAGKGGWCLFAKEGRDELSMPNLFLPSLLIRQVTPPPLGQRGAKSVTYTDEFSPCGNIRNGGEAFSYL